MKNSYLYVGLLLIACSGLMSGVAAQNSLILKLNNGTGTGIPLSSLNKITFSSGNMIVGKIDAGSDTYLLSDIQKMTFGLFSGVEEITADKTLPVVYPNPASTYIRLNNVADERNLEVKIYRIDGVQVLAQTLQSASDVININQLSQGIYLLKVSNQILKFTKQ
ncbi:MAG TPA: T9SS type A sorting domain-containing protein [Paludibacter sp.]